MSASNPAPFLNQHYSSPAEALAKAPNPEFWRWGLTFNQGNGMDVTEERVRERLSKIAATFLRERFGNKYRKKARIRFLVFQHNSADGSNRHFHALMGCSGEPHGMSDAAVADAIEKIDKDALKGFWSEKLVHVDFDWKKGNTFHSYVSRYVQADKNEAANWFML
jgi:hypothetical protein